MPKLAVIENLEGCQKPSQPATSDRKRSSTAVRCRCMAATDAGMNNHRQWTAREVRIEARRYAAALMDQQDDTPGWAADAGIPDQQLHVFADEMDRIAARIRRTIEPDH